MNRKIAFATIVNLLLCAPGFCQAKLFEHYYEAAQIQIEQRHWSAAESELKQALQTARNEGKRMPYALALGSLGQVYVHLGKYAAAESLLTNAVGLLESANYKGRELADYCFAYQDLLILTGRSNDALQVNNAIKQRFLEANKQQPATYQPRANNTAMARVAAPSSTGSSQNFDMRMSNFNWNQNSYVVNHYDFPNYSFPNYFANQQAPSIDAQYASIRAMEQAELDRNAALNRELMEASRSMCGFRFCKWH